MNSVREKTSASNERICKEEKAEFLIAQIAQIAPDCPELPLIAQGLPMIALIAISFFPLAKYLLGLFGGGKADLIRIGSPSPQ